jgi:hypothetical protein
MELIQYRDAGMNTYTYFYKNEKNQTISPFFNSEREARDWLELKKYQAEAQSLCTSKRNT